LENQAVFGKERRKKEGKKERKRRADRIYMAVESEGKVRAK